MKKALAPILLVLFLAFRPAPAAAEDAPPDPISLIHLMEGLDEDSTTEAPELKCPKDAKICAFSYRLQGPINDKAAEKIQKFDAAVKKAGGKAAMVEIVSPGGDPDAGQEIIRTIEMSSVKYVCVADGMAASAAFAILQSCDVRYMTKRSVLMTHNVVMEHEEGTSDVTTLDGARENLETMEAMSDAFAEQCTRHLKGMTMEQYRARIAHAAWFLSWKDAVNYGFVQQALAVTPNFVYHALLEDKLKELR